MSREVVVRLGAVAAVVGGLFSFCVNASLLLLASGDGAVAWAARPLVTLAGILTTFLYASGLVGLYALVGQRTWPYVAGVALAFLALLTTLAPWTFAVAYVLYQLVFVADGTITNPVMVFPELTVDLTGDLLLAGGVLLLGLGALRARSLGRWAFVPFVVALLTVLPPVFFAADGLLGAEFLFGWLSASLALARGLLWVLLGVVLWLRAPGARTGTAGAAPA